MVMKRENTWSQKMQKRSSWTEHPENPAEVTGLENGKIVKLVENAVEK